MASATYPLARKGPEIGEPYKGTHTLGNWQSDNAIDISVPVGTPVYAVADGRIGPRIGALGSTSSRFAGLRVTLEGGVNSYYYAHLSKLSVRAGQRVKAGDLIGYSGEANGVAHLHFAVERGDPHDALQGKVPDSTAASEPYVPPTPTVAQQPVPAQAMSAIPVQLAAPTQSPMALQTNEPGQVSPYQDYRKLLETWQGIAQQPLASPDSQGIAQMMQQGSGQ